MFFCTVGSVCLASGAGPQAPLDLDGRAVDPFSRDAKALVFLFVKSDCPISNRYAPEVRRLHAQFSGKGVLFWLVYPDADASPEAIRRHVKDYAYPCGVLRDRSHALVQLCRARVTPEAAVFTPNRQLVYHGRIDDRYVALGKWRQAPTQRDLEAAITALLAGNTIPASKPAIGCKISRPE